MESIHKTIEKEFDWLELDTLNELIKEKGALIKAQSLFLRGFVIRSIITYLQCKRLNKGTESQYTARIKGSCIMGLYIVEKFGYLTVEEAKQYMKLLSR